MLAVSGARYRRSLQYAPVVLAILLVVPGIGSRLLTLGELREGSTDTSDPSLVGRVAALQQGMAMVRDRPLTGVGAGNFVVAQPDYQRQFGTSYARVLAAHNLYLQLAAEGGIGALAAWVILFGAAMLLALRVALLRGVPPPLTEPNRALLAAGVVAGLAAWAFASAFLHLADLPMLAAVIALGVALARHAEPELEHAFARGRAFMRYRAPGRSSLHERAVRSAIVAVVFVAVVGLVGAVAPLRRTTTQAQADAVVTPRRAVDNAYVYDVANRRVVALTYAALVANPQFLDAVADELGVRRGSFSASVSTPLDSAIVTAVVRSADAETARAAAPRLVLRGSEYLRDLDTLFTLEPLPNSTVSRIVRVDGRNLAIALLAAFLAAVVFQLNLGPPRRSTRAPLVAATPSRRAR
jgi:capsular polysaccharide biosynthesis protein